MNMKRSKTCDAKKREKNNVLSSWLSRRSNEVHGHRPPSGTVPKVPAVSGFSQLLASAPAETAPRRQLPPPVEECVCGRRRATPTGQVGQGGRAEGPVFFQRRRRRSARGTAPTRAASHANGRPWAAAGRRRRHSRDWPPTGRTSMAPVPLKLPLLLLLASLAGGPGVSARGHKKRE